MEINFKNRLVYGTYFILWTVILNTVFSDMTTVACPATCKCSPATSCTGTYVGCGYKGLKEVPAVIPKDTCELYLSSNQITTIDNNAFAGLSQLNTLYIYRNPFECGCDLRQFVMFMQRKGILPYNDEYYNEPKCSSPALYQGMEIINVPYHNMSCDSTSETTLASSKTPFQDITRQRLLSTPESRYVPITNEPVVIPQKTTDDAPTQQIVKSTQVIGEQHTTGDHRVRIKYTVCDYDQIRRITCAKNKNKTTNVHCWRRTNCLYGQSLLKRRRSINTSSSFISSLFIHSNTLPPSLPRGL